MSSPGCGRWTCPAVQPAQSGHVLRQPRRVGVHAGQRGLRLVERYHTNFVRAGAKLGPTQKTRLGAINQELAGLFTKFSQNLLHDEDGYDLYLKEADLAGLPADVRCLRPVAARTPSAPPPAAIASSSESVPVTLETNGMRGACMFTLRAIGYVHSPYKATEQVPKGPGAKHEAEEIVAKAQRDAEALVERRTRMAEEKIAAEERAAVDQLRVAAADAATKAAARLIAERHDAGTDAQIVDRAIKDIAGR